MHLLGIGLLPVIRIRCHAIDLIAVLDRIALIHCSQLSLHVFLVGVVFRFALH